MNLFFKHFSRYKSLLLLIALLNMSGLFAADEQLEFEYIQIGPIIVTNYQKQSSKKPGFVQIKAQLTVKGKESVTKLLIHMPLVRDFVIEFLSFTDEKIIKDVKKRIELRASLTAGIKAMSDANFEEIRTHFHVPVFVSNFDVLDATQEDIIETLNLWKKNKFSNHLEVETYTWAVLPKHLQTDLSSSIVRELEWVRKLLNQ